MNQLRLRRIKPTADWRIQPARRRVWTQIVDWLFFIGLCVLVVEVGIAALLAFTILFPRPLL